MNSSRSIIILFWAAVFVFPVNIVFAGEPQQEQVLRTLYGLMGNKGIFMSEKENRISSIKKMLETPDINEIQRYEINLQLFNEYKTYISDSAIYYTKQNIKISGDLNDRDRMNESKLNLTSLYIIAGIYIESLDILKNIDKTELSDTLLIRYYDS